MIAIMSEIIVEQLVARALLRRRLEAGEFLFHQGDKVQSLFIVASGLVELMRHQPDGASIVLQRAGARTILAEASVYSHSYHCDAIAQSAAKVYELSRKSFLKHLNQDEYFAHQWAAHLAREVQSARYRSEILTLNTVAERLDGWLAWQNDVLPPKGERKSIATQIGVSPEALYRELAKRDIT